MSPSEGEKMEILVQMSTKEMSGLEVMQRLSKKQMSQKEAGEILNLGNRQIKRLLNRTLSIKAYSLESIVGK
jgi:predicted XRE-type DNA-binding protein